MKYSVGLEVFSEDMPALFYGIIVEQRGPYRGVSGITFGLMHISCLVHGLHGVWCFVSGMGRWHTG